MRFAQQSPETRVGPMETGPTSSCLRSTCAIFVLLTLACGPSCGAQTIDPSLAPSAAAPSNIRIWGHRDASALLAAWQDAFRKQHPKITLEDHLYGDASGLGSLYTGAGDLALLDHEAGFIEDDGYHQGAGHAPFAIPVAMGPLALPQHAPALLVYVHPANPIAHLTLDQLDAIFDADHRRGNRRARTWGDLGLTGEWASHLIHLYLPEISSPEVQFFERAAMQGSQKFSCCITVLQSTSAPNANGQVATVLGNDRFGIALATTLLPTLKQVALAHTNLARPVTATSATIADGSYPLARTLYLFVNRIPGEPLPSHLAEFLAFTVSPAGQALLTPAVGYLPLPSSSIHRAQESLR